MSKLNIQFSIFNFIKAISFLLLSFFNNTIITSAQGINDVTKLNISNLKCIFYVKDLDGCTANNSFFNQILDLIINIAPVVATLVIVAAGYEYFNDSALKKTEASKTLTSAVIGLIVVYLARPITAVLQNTFVPAQNTGDKFFIDPAPLIKFIDVFIDLLLMLGGIAAVVSIIIGGYEYIMKFVLNAGKSQSQVAPFDLIRNGIVGLLVVIFARPMVSIIQGVFGPTVNSSGITYDANGKALVSGLINPDIAPILNLVRVVLSQFLIPVASVAAVVSFIAAAYMFFFTGDNTERPKQAREMLSNAAIGLVVVLISATMVQLILYFVRPGDFIKGNTTTAPTPVLINPK